MDLPPSPSATPSASLSGASVVPRFAAVGLVLWLVMLGTLPDPRPLAVAEETVGTTGVSDDLYAAWQGTARHVLAAAADVPDGDEGFLELVRIAFAYADDNAHGTDAVLPSRAAILALGKLLGDDKVATVGGRDLELGPIEERNRLRQRIRLGGRGDLSKHFWVSAALTVLTDESRALAVGIAKEAMDSTPGGSGFSFVDMAANAAGIRLAAAATRNDAAAHALQARLQDGVTVADILPSVADLPEGLGRDALQADFGGLAGAETRRLLAEIDRRIAALPLYEPRAESRPERGPQPR